MTKTSLIRLMTWKRSTYCIFPYGLSIYPAIFSFLLAQLPAIALTYDVYAQNLGLLTYLVGITLIIWQILAQIFMIVCLYTDPGIIPQIVRQYEPSNQLFGVPSSHYSVRPEHKYLMASSNLCVNMKYCVECHIYRPTRTIHCQICNHCVQRYDHHCPWLSICIGKYNYKYFILYLLFLCILLIEAIIFCAYVIISESMKNSQITSYLIEIIVGAWCVIFSLSLIRLLFYHLWIGLKGLTTNENLKGVYKLLKQHKAFEPNCLLEERSLVSNHEGYILDDENLTERRDTDQQKGHRYSTILSGRESVLNYLIDVEL